MAHGHIDSFEIASYIRGHHVYKQVWTPNVGEKLVVKRETGNRHDEFAVAVEKDEEIVGHLPQHMCRIVSYFLNYSGNIASCTVTGQRINRGVGLGVEVPCIYKFVGQTLYIDRLKELLCNKK